MAVMNEVTVHMNTGSGDTSYANNSAHQKIGISSSWHVMEEALKDMFTDHGFTMSCFKMVDLGCSSGPNTLSVISRIINKVEKLCKEKNFSHSPEFEVFLNDLPENDFNNLFKMLSSFSDNLDQDMKRSRVYVSGLPGSFYDRLLPSKSLNFVYSSFSLQWLSQVPEGLESNRENIHMAMASPPEIYEAYAKQFHRDFSKFLRARGEEMLPGGRMVLIFVGRSVADPSLKDECEHFKLLADILVDMIREGLIKEADLHSFNLPIYTPSKQEVEAEILGEGSFNLDIFESFLVPWDAHVSHGNINDHYDDQNRRGELVSNFVRAYTEPVLAKHFGSSIMEDLYTRYGKKLAEHLSRKEPSFFNMIVCLSKI